MSVLYQLPYRVDLLEPASFGLAGTSFVEETEGFIPGSAVWGATAWSYLRARNLPSTTAHEDPEFRRLFLRGGLRFLNAYPAPAFDLGRRLLPAPRSLLHSKSDPYRVIDLSSDQAASGDEEERGSAIGGFGSFDSGVFTRHEALMSLAYHASRNDTSSNGDRARGRPVSGQGPFVYQSIQEGQSFQGLILADEADVDALGRVLPPSLQLGRSRSAQYGGATIAQGTPSPFISEASWLGEDDDEELDAPGGVILMLTSHLIPAWPSSGAPVVTRVLDELGRVLGLSGQPDWKEDARCFLSTTSVGGYSSVHKLPRTQRAALAAGSVFVLRKLTHVPRTAEGYSLGMRVSEGFGRFVLWPAGEEVKKLQGFVPVEVNKPSAEMPQEIRQLVERVVNRKFMAEALTRARQDAAEIKGRPTNTVLNRLHRLFTDVRFEEALVQLESLNKRDALARALRRFRIRGVPFTSAVTQWSETNPQTLDGIARLSGIINAVEINPAMTTEVRQAYVLHLLKEVARSNRPSASGAEASPEGSI